MATPQEEVRAVIKESLLTAKRASGKSLTTLWTLYQHEGGKIGVDRFRIYFNIKNPRIPDPLELDIIHGVLNELQDEIELPRISRATRGYFPLPVPDLPKRQRKQLLPRREHPIHAFA